jgi:hypothetical protein
MTPAAKLEALRARMKDLDLDVYLVPSDDPHLSGRLKASRCCAHFLLLLAASYTVLIVSFS